MAFNRTKSLAKAQKLLQKGKVAEAITEYQEVVDNDPADVRTLLKVGDLQAKLGNLEAANETYRKVAEHYAKDGFFLKAVAVFKQILKLDPGLISVYLRLAELYQQLGLNSEAMKQYQTVVKHYESKGLKKESLDILRKMADLDPENASSRVKLGELYAREGHREAATEQFRVVTEDLKKKQNSQELVRVYEKMEVLGFADDALRIELIDFYLKTAEPKKALERLQDLFRKDAKNPKILELLARTFLDMQQVEKAKSVFRELVGVYEERGMIEDRDRITAKLRTMGAAEPSSPEISGMPSQPVMASSPPKASVSAISSSAENVVGQIDPDKVVAESTVLLQYGLVEKACDALARAMLAHPAHAEARRKGIEAHIIKGDTVGLIDLLQRVIREAESRRLGDAVSALQIEISQLGGASSGAASESVESAGRDSLGLLSEEEINLEILDESPPVVTDGSAEFERPQESDAGFSLDEEIQIDSPPAAPESSAGEDFSFTLSTETVDASEPGVEKNAPEESIEIDVDLGAELAATEAPPMEMPSMEMPSMDIPELDEEIAEDIAEPVSEPVAEEETRQFRRVDMGDEDDPYATDVEEARFFVEQGLLEEARELLQDVLAKSKNHMGAKELLEEMEVAAPSKPKQTSEVADISSRRPRPSVVRTEEVAPPKSERTERILKEKSAPKGASDALFDLGSELQDEIQDLEESLLTKKPSDEEEYLSPEEVISEFKKGVARTVAKDDYPTHYSLGIAYKEMGLLDEAIHEFDLAAQDASLATDCASMIGLCLMGKREFDTAIEVYRRALGRISPASPEALGLSYELAEAYIGYGKLHDAYRLFARIRDVDPTFRDARRRAKELEADLGDSAPMTSAPEKARPKSEEKPVVEISAKKTKITYI